MLSQVRASKLAYGWCITVATAPRKCRAPQRGAEQHIERQEKQMGEVERGSNWVECQAASVDCHGARCLSRALRRVSSLLVCDYHAIVAAGVHHAAAICCAPPLWLGLGRRRHECWSGMAYRSRPAGVRQHPARARRGALSRAAIRRRSTPTHSRAASAPILASKASWTSSCCCASGCPTRRRSRRSFRQPLRAAPRIRSRKRLSRPCRAEGHVRTVDR